MSFWYSSFHLEWYVVHMKNFISVSVHWHDFLLVPTDK